MIIKLLYNDKDGHIYYAVPDNEYFYFTHTTNVPLSIFEIDEIGPDNKAVCIDLRRTVGKVDENGDLKYIVSDGILMEKEGWTEVVDVGQV